MRLMWRIVVRGTAPVVAKCAPAGMEPSIAASQKTNMKRGIANPMKTACRVFGMSPSSELTTTGTTLWYMNASAMNGNVSATAPHDPLPVRFSIVTPGAAMKQRPAKDRTAAPSSTVFTLSSTCRCGSRLYLTFLKGHCDASL